MDSDNFNIKHTKYYYFSKYSLNHSWDEVIYELRVHAGLTQREVANYLGISRKTYGNYERGMSEVKIESLIKLSTLYNIPVSIILGQIEMINQFIGGLKEND